MFTANAHALVLRAGHVLVSFAVTCSCGGVGADVEEPALTPMGAAQVRTARWTGRIEAGGVIDVRTVQGNVRAVAAAGEVAEVDTQAPAGRPGGPSPVRIFVDEHGVSVRAEQTTDRRFRVADGDDATVDLLIHVPPGVRFVARSVQGAIEIVGLTSYDVKAVNGTIDLRGVAGGRARTIDGTIRASFAGSGLEEDTELRTVNGLLDVVLPARLGASIDAQSGAGRISVELPASGALELHAARGLVRPGGSYRLLFSSVNGLIRFARAPS